MDNNHNEEPKETTTSLPSVIMTGYLYKRGWEKWSKRWFILYDDFVLLYFKKNSNSPSGIFDMRSVALIDYFYHGDERFVYSFLVKLKVRTRLVSHFFCADSLDLMNMWVKAMSMANEDAIINVDCGDVDVEFEVSKKYKRDYTVTPHSFSQRGYHKTLGRAIVKRIAKTAIGRTLVQKFISEDGFAFFETIKDIIAQIEGEVRGKSWEKDIMVLAAEIVYLIEDGIIDKESVLLCRDSVYRLWSDTLDMLELSFAYNGSRFYTSMKLCINDFISVTFDCLKEERRDMIEGYASFFKNKDNIHRFFNDEEFSELRTQTRTILRRVWDATFSFDFD
eukprot:TRINITY_DN12933_c0_g1_i1.p1 TRINITY_DN12933_c0_g1~~TRINITY_DN12933_c0_g1_i1.p1  ORF type:complete len:335 (+),score=63.16 TRINITY_DN12933_c0_g1_i1:44-1048(+)